MMTRFVRPFAVLLLALGAACAGWHRVDPPANSIIRRRQQVQVWEKGKPRVFHAVRLTADSLYGIPFFQPPVCDSCVITIPRADIDSLRFGNQEGPAVVGIMLPLAGGLFLLYAATRGLRD